MSSLDHNGNQFEMGPVVRLNEIRLRTLPFTPDLAHGYDPIPALIQGRKLHTLRGQPKRGHYEVAVKGKRTGLIVEAYNAEKLTCEEYLIGRVSHSDWLSYKRLTA